MNTKRMTASKASEEKLLGSSGMFLSDARQPKVVIFFQFWTMVLPNFLDK